MENHVESQEIAIDTSSMDDNRIYSETSSDLYGIDIDETEEASSDLSRIDIDKAEEARSNFSGIDIDVAEEASSDLSGMDIDEAKEASSDLSGIDIDEAEDGSLIAEANTEEIRLDSINLYVESSQNGLHKNVNKVKDVAFSYSQGVIDEPFLRTSVSVYNSQLSYEHRETSE